ncbi:MAG: ABC transporter permease [Bacteroidia bacterium]|nr:ABC transporter permease [Bacteroidia bacterium]
MIREALKALWEYRLRAILTLTILAFGITALVGILTTLEALRGFIAKDLAGLGTQTFVITGGEVTIQIGRRKSSWGKQKGLRLWETEAFEQQYNYPGARISRHILLTPSAQAEYQGRKTPTQLRVFGVDPAYFQIQELSLKEGRFFNKEEVKKKIPVIVIGFDIAAYLFPKESSIGKWIRVGESYYRVIGVLKKRGGLFGMNLDVECFIPWSVALTRAAQSEFSLYVGAPSVQEVPAAMQAARPLLRALRQLRPKDADAFHLFRGEQLADFVLDQLQIVTWTTLGISLITLFGATLSLMNILLVIVKERTHEIGLRMAIGATRRDIRLQFLSEALVIAILGGAIGILLGIAIGNGVAWLIGSSFVMPWKWVIIAVSLSACVGLLAGYQPAQEASQLNPVEALRYE